MRRIWIAIRVFFLALFYREVARRVELLLQTRAAPVETLPGELPRPQLKPAPARPAAPKPPARSEAITLLATLQREARLVDFIKEPLGAYSDAQIGAAAREVHRDCGLVVERLFGLVPVVQQDEGSEIELAAGFDSGRFRLTGNVAGEPPFRGRLAHHGWEATRCELPAWSGKESSARVVAPAEVELP